MEIFPLRLELVAMFQLALRIERCIGSHIGFESRIVYAVIMFQLDLRVEFGMVPFSVGYESRIWYGSIFSWI